MSSLLIKFSIFAIIIAAALSENNTPSKFLPTQKTSYLQVPEDIDTHLNKISEAPRSLSQTLDIPRGGVWFPAGYHPYGYGLTDLAQEFLQFEGSLDSDIGRFLASLKSGRKKRSILKEQWVEVVRVSKTGQSMRILRTLDDLIEFCIKVGFIN